METGEIQMPVLVFVTTFHTETEYSVIMFIYYESKVKSLHSQNDCERNFSLIYLKQIFGTY